MGGVATTPTSYPIGLSTMLGEPETTKHQANPPEESEDEEIPVISPERQRHSRTELEV